MTITSASRRWVALASGAVTTSAVAAALVLLAAAPASAHTPAATPGCAGDHATLKVVLTQYNSNVKNHVTVMDGNTVLADQDFKQGYTHNFPDAAPAPQLSGTVTHHFVVDVKAGDDPDGSKGFTWHWAKDTEKCVTETTTTTTTTKAETTTTTTTQAAATTTTTTTEVAVGANANLASTGASIGLPLVIGVLLLLVGGGALFYVNKRRRV